MGEGKLPEDPAICMSFVNTKLRDCYGSLEELCGDFGIGPRELCGKLEQAGFIYDEAQKRFR